MTCQWPRSISPISWDVYDVRTSHDDVRMSHNDVRTSHNDVSIHSNCSQLLVDDMSVAADHLSHLLGCADEQHEPSQKLYNIYTKFISGKIKSYKAKIIKSKQWSDLR